MKLILLATYWNEKEWISKSLKQIERINPDEIVICDGCFDPKQYNGSKDGTREIIEDWAKDKDNVTIIKARRYTKVRGIISILTHNFKPYLLPLYILLFFYYLKVDTYRINQAVTFNYMSSLCKKWSTGKWFMTYDSDQFYSDECIESIKSNLEKDLDLMTANERTFPYNYTSYTLEYEKRNYNNMPHKIKDNTLILPTRDIVMMKYPKPKVYGKSDNIKKINLGYYNHYKFRTKDVNRLEEGYKLGDREKPDFDKYTMIEMTDNHPKVIRD